MDRIVVAIAVALALFLSFPKAFADKFNTETSSSARALGMGNVGVNTERGSYSLFYNPANLAARETKLQIQPLNMQLEVSDGWFARSSDGSYHNFNNLSGMYPDLNKNKNTWVAGRFSVYPNITFQYFSIGLLYETNRGAEMHASDNKLHLKARDRFGPTFGLSYRFFKGILRLGASAQIMTVGQADDSLAQPINGSSLEYSRFINAGTGIKKDAGITLTLPFRLLPSFSIVARDIGGTRYKGPKFVHFGDLTGVPDDEMTFDFGTSLTIYLAKRLDLRVAMDYRDYVNKLDGAKSRHINAGGELSFFDAVKLRVGMSHGYMTYGIGINLPKASLDFATYADEKGEALRGDPDRRYVIQYTWNLGGGGGGSRKK